MTSPGLSPWSSSIRRTSLSTNPFLLRPESSSSGPISRVSEEETCLRESAPLITSSSKSSLTSLPPYQAIHTVQTKRSKKRRFLSYVKIGTLCILSIIICIFISLSKETEERWQQMILNANRSFERNFSSLSQGYGVIRLTLRGPLTISDSLTNGSDLIIGVDNDTWKLTVNESLLNRGGIQTFTYIFECHSGSGQDCNLWAKTDRVESVAVLFESRGLLHAAKESVIYAAIILLGVYILIGFEIIHRTLAAILGSMSAMAVLAALNERPSMEKIMASVDLETISLLFGMMIIVAIFSDTGVFDFSAMLMYRVAKGKVFVLVSLLCLFSAVVSAFLDNVTTILLLAPVTIKLCEVLNLDPKQILIAEVIFSNIGGTGTAIGDPPNVIIVATTSKMGINFAIFTGHAFTGIFFITLVSFGVFWLYYRKTHRLENPENPQIAEMQREVEVWRRTAASLLAVTREECLMKALFLQKAAAIENKINRELHRWRRESERDFNDTLQNLSIKYQLTDRTLLIKSSIILFLVISLLFLHSFISGLHLGLGWIALMGAIWLLVLADVKDFESLLHKVEWSTLIFFASLFTLMEALAQLGLIDWIGDMISNLILTVGPENRLTAALAIVLWISAIASSFIDNIPYTTAMVPVLTKLSEDPKVDLPLLPLIMALTFGACLGGNGTLIGASCNVVCVGIAEQHGYKISFKDFFVMGFPIMIITTAVSMVYLMICHIALGWNT